MKPCLKSLFVFVLIGVSMAAPAELPIPCGACNGGVWVSSGNATLTTSTNALTIDQQTERAILNWQSFNISAGSSVNFNQPSTSSVALNRIFQSDPSRILGSLSANGQVLLINQNGILFGAGAQVNTHSLIASTLGMADDVFESLGLTGAINSDRAAFEGSSSASIDIESGASIKTAKDGRILIIAPEINNAGTLESPDGQTVLAASSDKVYLEASTDPELRGLLVEVETGGDVNNIGTIIAERGNATLLGAAVNQSGVVRATTSVNRNGTVRLLGRDNASTIANPQNSALRNAVASRAGSVTLGSGSRTEVLIDSSDQSLASDAQAQATSRIEIVAEDVTIKSRAKVAATGGEIDILAAENIQNPLAENFAANDASLILENGAMLDVSGASESGIPFDRNFVEVDLRGNELRDNPVNRDGAVRGETVVVDARRGTNFADVAAFIEATERSTAERLSTGGTITLRSEGDLALESGAVIDISGGAISFTEGYNTASYLSREGSLTSISDADPNILYDGVFNFIERDYEKWSVSEVFNPFRDQNLWLKEPGYTQGADAGSLNVVARNIVFDSDVIAATTRGVYQRFAPSADSRTFEEIPIGGAVTIGDANTTQQDFKLGDLSLGSGTDGFAGTEIPVDALLGGGVANLRIFSNGRISVPAGTDLQLGNGGTIALRGGDIDIAGGINAPGGTISLHAAQTTTKANESQLRLAESGELNAAGGWTNDFADLSAGRPLAPVFSDAGNVGLQVVGDLILETGSLINVNGGGYVDDSATLIAGLGGDVSLSAEPFSPTVESSLVLDGEIRGFSAADSGTLSLSAQGFVFGDQQIVGHTTIAPQLFVETGFQHYEFIANTSGIVVPAGVSLSLARKQLLFGRDNETASDVRFSELTSTAVGGVNELLGSDPSSLSTGEELFANTVLGQVPLAERKPVNLALRLVRGASDDGELRVEAGASIEAEPGATITLESDRDLFFDGQILAPGGSVSLTTKRRESVEEGYLADQSLWLGNNALIDVSAIFIETPQVDGLASGTILDAGEITLSANRSYLIAESGSELFLNGVVGEVDVIEESSGIPVIVRHQVAGDAGRLNLRSGDGLFFDGEVSMNRAPIATSVGGSIDIDINAGLRETRTIPLASGAVDFLNGARQIRIGAALPNNLARGAPIDPSLNGTAIVNSELLTNADLEHLGLNAPAQVAAGGLVNPNAFGTISFERDIELNIGSTLRLYTPEINVAGANVSLAAPVIELGSLGQATPYIPTLTAGDGTLSVVGDLVAVRGQLAVQGAAPSGVSRAPVKFIAATDLILAGTSNATNNADIVGSLSSASDLFLQAARIFPTTLSNFTIEVNRPGGRIITANNGSASRVAPLSVAGQLNFRADNILQAGNLFAPFGKIDIDADSVVLSGGSLTSVSGAGNRFLFGQTQFELDWLLPFDGINVVLATAPEKRISIDAENISIADGSLIDLSGGGDLQAFEFVPGPGGSIDILDPTNAGESFAILPNTFTQPLDNLTGVTEGRFGETFILSDNSILAAGEYAVLPARYALLPGAYLVSPGDSTMPASPGTTALGSDEIPVVAGKLSSFASNAEDQLYSSYRLLSGAAVRARSEYAETTASNFFATTLNTTDDNGALSLAASEQLAVGGSILSSGLGRASNVDLVADRIAIVDELGGSAPGTVEILAQDLSNLGAGSLLIGGSRTQLSSTSAEIAVATQQIDLMVDAELLGSEIILAAADDINLNHNSLLAAHGNAIADSQLVVNGDSALVAVSTGELALSRVVGAGITGSLDIATGATVSATGSLIVDGSADAAIVGNLNATGAKVSLGGKRIAVGNVPLGVDGLVLSDNALAGLDDAQALALRSSSTIDLYGAGQLNLQEVSIDASGFTGILAAGETFTINAEQLSLSNRTGSTITPLPGNGALALTAESLDLSAGALAFDGFDHIAINAGVFTWSGDSSLDSPVAMSMNVGEFAALSNSELSIAVDGDLSVTSQALSDSMNLPTPVLGGRFNVVADVIDFSSTLRLPSGQASFTSAVGNVALNGAVVDLSGRAKTFDGTLLGSGGGLLNIQSANHVDLSNAQVNVSGQGAQADQVGELGQLGIGGRIAIKAIGEVEITNTSLSATVGGEFSITGDQFDTSALLTKLVAGGFDESLEVRVKNADIAIGADQVLNARWISLVSDNQDVAIDGSLQANGQTDGGRIRLFAGNELVVADGAVISAQGADGHGGVIELGTSTGSVSVGAALFDLTGSDVGGMLKIRAPAVGNASAIDSLAASFQGVDLLEVEVFQTSTGTVQAAVNGLGTLNTNLANVRTAFGLDGLAFARVVPGAEVQLAGNYSTPSELDLSNTRFSGLPGVLTLRVANDININHTISDGIVNYNPFPGQLPPRDGVGSDESWSYRIVAGADLQSADPLAVFSNTGDISLANNTQIRTGTGDIDIASGGSLNLLGTNTNIYSVGKNRGTGSYGPVLTEVYLEADFVEQGGSLNFDIGNNINALARDQLINDWLARYEGSEPFQGLGTFGAGWAISASRFQQGVGALGGGDIRIRAGGDIAELGVVVPTTGLPTGGEGSLPSIAGGGSIDIASGGDFLGGLLYAAKGNIALVSGGAVTASSPTSNDLFIALGDGQADLLSQYDLTTEAIFDPFLIPQSTLQGVSLFGTPLVVDKSATFSYFSNYRPDTGVRLESVAGIVEVAQDTDALSAVSSSVNIATTSDRIAARVTPPTLELIAHSDSVLFADSFTLYPSAIGQLAVYAENDISNAPASSDSIIINQSDADPSLLPSVTAPGKLNDLLAERLAGFDNALGTSHALTPIHINDDVPVRLVARNGLLGTTGSSAFALTLAKQADIFAGGGIQNLNLQIQHGSANDFSIIESGADIAYPFGRTALGFLLGATGQLALAGPGTMAVVAQGNIDLGASRGIVSLGDTKNPNLPDSGADLIVMPGFAPTDNLGFLEYLLALDDSYGGRLTEFVNLHAPTASDSFTAFKNLNTDLQRTLLVEFLFNELVTSGVEATSTGSDDYTRGFAAIDQFFDADESRGDLSLLLSRIATIDGGDVNLLVPGGFINAGIASATAFERTPDQLGIVAQRAGDVNIFVRDDLLVNQSRVFTLDGGRIAIWSSAGDIDAGRGAKSAVSIPGLVTTIDAAGNVVTEFPPAIEGSGIRAAVATPGLAPGDVFLFAPRGAVIAGDAGIGSAGNLTIGATEVVGADNIDVGGVAVGVPASDVGSVAAGLTGVSDSSTSASKSAQDNAGQNVAANEEALGEALSQGALSFISVEVLGFGG